MNEHLEPGAEFKGDCVHPRGDNPETATADVHIGEGNTSRFPKITCPVTSVCEQSSNLNNIPPILTMSPSGGSVRVISFFPFQNFVLFSILL